MNKKAVILKILGLLLIIGSFLYNQYTIFRFLLKLAYKDDKKLASSVEYEDK